MPTKFALSNLNPGSWFSFNENDPESGSICVRTINDAERNKIRKATRKKRVEYKRGQRFEVEDFDDDAFTKMLWDYCIVDWKDLEDDDGNPIECTVDNKLKLIREHVGFQLFVSNCIEKVTEEIEDHLRLVEKN